MQHRHHKLIILGSGPAGCTAAIYASRFNLQPVIIVGPESGGQLMRTAKISNWPGEPEVIAGTTLMDKMLQQARSFGAVVAEDTIQKVDLMQYPFRLWGKEAEYTCQSLIIATGASPLFLGIPSEQQYLGHGVSTCAVCDGFFYKNKSVIVIGGGDTAAREALYLAQLATQVTLIHRRDTLRAEHVLAEQLNTTSNIKLLLNYEVKEIIGNDQEVLGIQIENKNTHALETIDTNGVFLAIGNKPNTELFVGQLTIQNNHIKIFHDTLSATSVPGVFAAGDVAVPGYHQAIVASGLGCTAALDAKKFLTERTHGLS